MLSISVVHKIKNKCKFKIIRIILYEYAYAIYGYWLKRFPIKGNKNKTFRKKIYIYLLHEPRAQWIKRVKKERPDLRALLMEVVVVVVVLSARCISLWPFQGTVCERVFIFCVPSNFHSLCAGGCEQKLWPRHIRL